MYNKMTEKDFDALRAITAPSRVLVGEDISRDYYHDELGGIERAPEVLVRVHETEEVSKIMKLAYEKMEQQTVDGRIIFQCNRQRAKEYLWMEQLKQII